MPLSNSRHNRRTGRAFKRSNWMPGDCSVVIYLPEPAPSAAGFRQRTRFEWYSVLRNWQREIERTRTIRVSLDERAGSEIDIFSTSTGMLDRDFSFYVRILGRKNINRYGHLSVRLQQLILKPHGLSLRTKVTDWGTDCCMCAMVRKNMERSVNFTVGHWKFRVFASVLVPSFPASFGSSELAYTLAHTYRCWGNGETD